MNSATKELFKNWVGTWLIKRILGSQGIAEGTAKFTLQNNYISKNQPIESKDNLSKEMVLLYREDLKVKYNSEVMSGQGLSQSAYKEYLYIYDETRDKIIKKFVEEEGDRFFYELNLDLEKGTGFGEHLCEKDLYKANYSFKDKEHFSLNYSVKGPQKDYVIITEFNKISSDS